MPAAPIPPHELRRLAAVQKLRLLGTPAEERFDKITRLARRIFDVPMACLDIVGEKLAWLKSVQGFDGIEACGRIPIVTTPCSPMVFAWYPMRATIRV